MELKDKVTVVTGGARRVGRAIVEALVDAGSTPIIHYHESRREAEALASSTGGHAVGADLSKPEGARRLVTEALQLAAKCGDIAAWVNSAASFEQRTFLETDDDLWARTLQLGLLSPVSCIRQVAPRMLDGGVIVNILDVAATQAWRGYSHHCVSKAALQMLTRTLALELAPRLRVCGVTPGLVLPPEESTEQQRRRWTSRVPLGRQGAPEDVGQAVRFVLEADYLTGSVITVDGGMSAR